jgi:dipeptidyl aminopeptidase/acylaminoacyl peptidase
VFFMTVEKVFFENGKGQKLAAWLHVPEGDGPFAAVVRAHGYKSSKDGSTSVALAEEFADFVFLRFDFHGHGESEGDPEKIDAAQCVDDMKQAVEYVKNHDKVDPTRIGITGTSLGGLATTLTALHPDVAVAVPVCPVSDFEPFRVRDIKYFELLDEMGKTNVYAQAEKITCPVLIIHGDKDTIVPISQSMELVKHLRRGTLHVVVGGNHWFGDGEHFNQMIENTVDFLREHLQ